MRNKLLRPWSIGIAVLSLSSALCAFATVPADLTKAHSRDGNVGPHWAAPWSETSNLRDAEFLVAYKRGCQEHFFSSAGRAVMVRGIQFLVRYE